MKKFMKLIPALAMLLIATTLVSTATFAWFSMNNTVQATNMQVKAIAEKGLLINEVRAYDSNTWDEEATTNQTAGMSVLYPSSTTDGSTWYHAASKRSNNAADATSGHASDYIIGEYETLSGLSPIDAMSNDTAEGNVKPVYSTMGKTGVTEAGYYVKYTYYLKSAGAAITLNSGANPMYVIIKSVKATLPGTQASADLNKALRVGIKLNEAFYIYAPVAGYDDAYFVAAGATATNPKAGDVLTFTDLGTLPATGNTTGGAPVDVYIWYEGEDTNCKSDNATAAALDNIQIDIKFELGSSIAVTGAFDDTAKVVDGKNYYQVGTTGYYANTATYNANKTSFFTITGEAGSEVVKVANVAYTES